MKRQLLILATSLFVSLPTRAEVTVEGMRVCGLSAPLGIDETPTFSWQTKSSERGFQQQSYEITVSRADGVQVWSSGMMESQEQTGIKYAGEQLESCTAYTWTVRVVGVDGSASTSTSTFETAFLSADEWQAQWITNEQDVNARVSLVLDETVTTRYLRLDATKLGYPASTDNTGYYMQFAEVEIYGLDGQLAYTPTASSNFNYSTIWNLNYINDGLITSNSALGYTTEKFYSESQHVYLTFDLGEEKTVSSIVLYPRQDDCADGHSDCVANFPSDFTLQLSADGSTYDIFATYTDQYPSYVNASLNVPYYGRNFTISKKVSRARIYASGLGVFTMKMNGEPVTDARLEPGESEYEKSVLYSTYDVTSLVHEGQNVLLAQVCGGIYNIEKLTDRYSKGEIVNSGTTGLLAELHIDYEDGTSDTILTDADWRTTTSATLGSNWWGGEDYDARLYDSSVEQADLDVSTWAAVQTFTPQFASSQASGFGQLRSRMYEPVRVVEEWQAVAVNTCQSGGYTLRVVDFGRNFAGTYKFRLKGKAGQTITLREGESIKEDGSVLMENFYTGSSDQYETYTFRGDEDGEEWGPEFMYHGFRYLQIIGLDEEPSADSFTAYRLRSDMENSGSFSSSNTLLNDIHVICRDAIASQLYNTITDCPHREKLGWLDVPNEMFNSLTYNFDLQAFFRKVVLDCFDAQYADGHVPSTVPHYMSVYDDDPNWGGAAILVPYRCWKTYGDASLFTDYYSQMKDLIDYYTSKTTDGIMQDISVLSDWGQESAGVSPLVSSQFTITTTYYYLLRVMAEMAEYLGITDDAVNFTSLAETTRAAFNAAYYENVSSGVYGNGQQSELAMPLYYGLVDEGNEETVAAALAARVVSDGYKIKTGEIALKPLFMSLAKYGYNDIVYQMANQTDCPSYGYWVVEGYTTTPEYWDVGEYSQNHCMMDHIEEWIFSELGGIKTSDNGFSHIDIAPWIPSDMTSLNVSTFTNYGSVSVSYVRTDSTSTYTVEVPANTTASITLPMVEGQILTEDGEEVSEATEGVSSVVRSDADITVEVGSGTYVLTVASATVDAIATIPNARSANSHPLVYSLDGVQTTNPRHGIYILEGKKQIIK